MNIGFYEVQLERFIFSSTSTLKSLNLTIFILKLEGVNSGKNTDNFDRCHDKLSLP
jgi:hypothetical protein